MKEEEVKEEEVKPAAKPVISTGLSWDFGSSTSGSALSFNFGPAPASNGSNGSKGSNSSKTSSGSTNTSSISSNADLLSLLSKMEKKTGVTPDSKAFSTPNLSVPSNSKSQSQSKSSKSKSKPQPKSHPHPNPVEASHPQVPELFVDVSRLFSVLRADFR